MDELRAEILCDTEVRARLEQFWQQDSEATDYRARNRVTSRQRSHKDEPDNSFTLQLNNNEVTSRLVRFYVGPVDYRYLLAIVEGDELVRATGEAGAGIAVFRTMEGDEWSGEGRLLLFGPQEVGQLDNSVWLFLQILSREYYKSL